MRELSVLIHDHIPQGDTVLGHLRFGRDLSLPDAPAISWTKGLPGGDKSLSVGIAAPDLFGHVYREYGTLQEDPALPRLAMVHVHDGAEVLWEGYVPTRRYEGAHVSGFQATGYSGYLNLGVLESSDTTERMADSLLAAALLQAMPLITLESAEGVGSVYTLDQFDGQPVARIIEQIATEGTAAGHLVDWQVLRGRRLKLAARQRPSDPDYWSPFKRGVTEYEEDDSRVRAAVKVTYRDTAGVDQETAWSALNPLIAANYGYPFRQIYPGGVLTSRQAETFRDKAAEQLATPERRFRGRFNADFPLRDRHGNPVDHARVEPGQWYSMGDSEPLMILSVSYTANTDEVQIEAESEWQSLDALLGRLNRYAEGLANQIQPLTGARTA